MILISTLALFQVALASDFCTSEGEFDDFRGTLTFSKTLVTMRILTVQSILQGDHVHHRLLFVGRRWLFSSLLAKETRPILQLSCTDNSRKRGCHPGSSYRRSNKDFES
jgi:hypothetical protein